MSGLSIVYIGEKSGTSRHRANALERLGHQVVLIDPYDSLPGVDFATAWADKTGCLFLGGLLHRRMLKAINGREFDLAWIDSGHLVSAGLVQDLKRCCGKVINYNIDDPYGTRDGQKWRLYLESVPYYDLVVVVRDINVAEAQARGAKDAIWVYRSADEVAHAGRELTRAEYQKWSSEVAFIGTWMPERGPFLVELIEAGVPLSIRGNRWQRAKEWPKLEPYWKGPSVDTEDEYRAAICGAKVCLGLLSKGNRDLSTTRTFEIPYMGGVLCAERTSEHMTLYTEDKEAVFWSDAKECAEKCRRLLADDEWRRKLAAAGRARCIANGTTNEKIVANILERVVPGEQSLAARAEGWNLALG